MSKIKAISIVNLRKHFQTQAKEKEQQLLADLPENLKTLYLTAITNTWTEHEKQSDLYFHMARILFPDDDEMYIKLGKISAQYSFTGIYRVFLHIPSPDYVIKRFVNIWHLHHDTGKPSYDNYTGTSIDFWVRDFPTLPRIVRQFISGHMLKIMELMKLNNCEVHHIEDNPKAWHWHLIWK